MAPSNSNGTGVSVQTLINNTLIVASCALGVFFTLRLLLHSTLRSRQLKVRRLSQSMLFYLALHLVGCLCTLPYYAYVIVQWQGGRLIAGKLKGRYRCLSWAGDLPVTSSLPLLYEKRAGGGGSAGCCVAVLPPAQILGGLVVRVQIMPISNYYRRRMINCTRVARTQ